MPAPADIQQFAMALQTARMFFRHAPWMVVAKELPENFRLALPDQDPGANLEDGPERINAESFLSPEMAAPSGYLELCRGLLDSLTESPEGEEAQVWQQKMKLIYIVMGFDEERELGLLETFVDVIKSHSGSTSPAEELLLSMLRSYEGTPGLTPESADCHIEEFKEHFRMMRRATGHFVRQYPEMMVDYVLTPSALAREVNR